MEDKKIDNGRKKLTCDQATVRLMVSLYCRHHLRQREPSAHYLELADYACARLARCRWGDAKPACKDCPSHCYRKDKREEIIEVMRWTGPRMIFYAPRATFRHLWQSVRFLFHPVSKMQSIKQETVLLVKQNRQTF